MGSAELEMATGYEMGLELFDVCESERVAFLYQGVKIGHDNAMLRLSGIGIGIGIGIALTLTLHSCFLFVYTNA